MIPSKPAATNATNKANITPMVIRNHKIANGSGGLPTTSPTTIRKQKYPKASRSHILVANCYFPFCNIPTELNVDSQVVTRINNNVGVIL